MQGRTKCPQPNNNVDCRGQLQYYKVWRKLSLGSRHQNFLGIWARLDIRIPFPEFSIKTLNWEVWKKVHVMWMRWNFPHTTFVFVPVYTVITSYRYYVLPSSCCPYTTQVNFHTALSRITCSGYWIPHSVPTPLFLFVTQWYFFLWCWPSFIFPAKLSPDTSNL